MPAPFLRITVAQFAELVQLFDFKRKVTSFDVHHTWIPRRRDFKGLESIKIMDRVHRTERGFSDIAQHITLDPEGFIWTGRAWNSPPASATGFNGSSKAGPFMMEMIGNFDSGREPFDGDQADNAYVIVAIILKRFGLDTGAVRFHNEMSSKSCPGTSISKADFVTKVDAALAALPELTDQSRDLFMAGSLVGLLEPLSRQVTPRAADADGELPEEEETYRDYAARIEAEIDLEDDASRGEKCPTPVKLAELVPHVVNLRRGQFSEDDLFVSNKGTVDAIFAGLEARAKDPAKPLLKVAFLAHGGLVSQRAALCKAHRDLWWWRENGIYPIFFVWHTDLGSAIRDVLLRAREGQRDLATVSDRIIEGIVRHFGGIPSWDSMKLSAADASIDDGGALYVATKLQALIGKHGKKVELHAIGHSAGAIFHSHFLRAAKVEFESLHLLAPAIRIDEYKARLDGLIAPPKAPKTQKPQVRNPVIYTMRDRLERADNCVTVYRKSLLYLISRGLEIRRDEPILGMERFLTNDALVAERFGISPGPGTVGEVFFSPSAQSKATAHGCFDDDIATMDTIVAAIRKSPPSPSYAQAAAGNCNKGTAFEDDRPIPRELAMFLEPVQVAAFSAPSLVTGRSLNLLRSTGRRRALCVGINSYPTAPLHGCVADAELWARTLVGLGFEPPTMLVDASATRQAIIDTLTRMLATSGPGDLVVFQFAGHGTEVRDLDGDETSPKDQALCPYDFADGRLLIDDDVADIFTKIPSGMDLTCFLDNCHSGTATRFAVGRASTRAATGDLPRFIVASPQLEEKHAIFRRSSDRTGSRNVGSRGPDTMREVVFSACKPEELAWESNGQGDFTRNAVALLTSASAITNEQFQDRLSRNFTPSGRQHPTLDCAPSARSASLFGLGPQPQDAEPSFAKAPAASSPSLSKCLRELADIVDRG